ncbi:MAG: peptide chain release factor N(5)-glutamine methyltransferase [Bacillota bacterium]|nr:peptide chain release factor N(5)-glutamine methyltransferase [Bacillota bacterium]
MVSASALYREAVKELKTARIESAKFEAGELISYFSGLSKSDILLEKQCEDDAAEKIRRSVTERIKGRPLQYILGEWEFCGREILCREGVLIPREDTETLVRCVACEMEKRYTPGSKIDILDLCCGSGCVGLGLWHLLKDFKVNVVSADVSEEAINLTEDNAVLWKASSNFKVIKADVLAGTPVNGLFDVIVSNPPYIKTDVMNDLQPEVLNFEPHIALDGGHDGLDFYREIACHYVKNLKDEGILAVEIGFDEREKVTNILKDAGFAEISSVDDLNGNNRVVYGIKIS